MSLPPILENLALPVICSPMFIAGNPRLVAEQCKAGVVGSFPALNARPKEALDGWLTEIEAELENHRKAHPEDIVAPYAVNQIVHKSNDRLAYDVEVDGSAPPERNALAIVAAWQGRQRPSAFERMRD